MDDTKLSNTLVFRLYLKYLSSQLEITRFWLSAIRHAASIGDRIPHLHAEYNRGTGYLHHLLRSMKRMM